MEDQVPTPAEANGDDASMPQMATIAQYLKDLSVESPNAPAVFQWQEGPQLDVEFNIQVSKVGDEVQEVALKVTAAAKSAQGTHFLVDLVYAGLFGFRNIPEEALAPFLLAEAPRLLFPFARQIIADATQTAGFPPLLLEPIDFGAAYMHQVQQQAQAAGNGNGNGAAEPQLGDLPATDDA